MMNNLELIPIIAAGYLLGVFIRVIVRVLLMLLSDDDGAYTQAAYRMNVLNLLQAIAQK